LFFRVPKAGNNVYTQVNINTLANPDTKKYLIEELTVYNVISTKSLKDVKDFPPKIKDATLMGRPAYYLEDPKLLSGKSTFEDDIHRAITRAQIASGNITDLPGTEKEIQNIAKILKSKNIYTKYFVGKNSTEEAFKLSSADILHIATHGFWFKEDDVLENADAMFNSGLLLAGVKNYYEGKGIASGEDGILTAYEVQGMNLANTKLVVLSACETAAGHVEAGEGVFGLQRAFSIAGSDKLIMSLWKVDDTATQQLFTEFYASLVKGSSSVSEAFQKAQHSIRQKYQQPYYWGAFVLVD
jgi:CHAT domain-containing protein